MPSSAASRCTIAMQPSKSVSSASTSAPLASGWTSCAAETRARGRMTTDGIPADAAERRAVGDHLLDDRHQHRHPEVLERAGVRVAAHLDPDVVEPELAAVALGPEEVRAAFVHRH